MIKIKLLVILFFSTIIQVFAQAKPVYFNGNRITTDANQATSYGVYGKLSNQELWVLKRYDLYDNLMFSGTYKDDQLTTPHGKFTFYGSIYDYNYENFSNFKNFATDRYIRQTGEFVNGLEEGKWTDYFPDGKVKGYRNFVNGELDGDLAVFSYKGRRLLYGNYKNGLKHGIFYDVKKKLKQVYENDKLISSKKLSRAEIRQIE
jgi:antitoxin component YwqK of YwqJK toxin-antitoxin module